MPVTTTFDSLSFTGIRELEHRLLVRRGRVERRAAQLLTQAANRIIRSAQNEYIPYDQGDLHDSAEIDPPVFESPHGVSVTMAFGRSGIAHGYALAIHEHLSRHSPPTWHVAESRGSGVRFTVGGPKYLEIPFRIESAHLHRTLAPALLVS